MDWIQHMDEQIIWWIQEYLLREEWNGGMILISRLGNGGFLWIALGILFLLCGICNRKFLKYGCILLLCLGVTALVCNVVLKPLVGRIRPYDLLGFPILIPPLSDFSFPSGHTSASFAAATALFAMHRTWGAVAYVFAGWMGISRLYLGVHFPSDVVSGALIGFVLAKITIFCFAKITEKMAQQSFS